MSATQSSIPELDRVARPSASTDGTAVRLVLANALALVVAYALPRVLTLGAVIIAARVLGAARFGAYATAGATAVILSILSTAGMQPLLVREMARDPRSAPGLLRAAHWIKTGLNGVMLIALCVLADAAFGLQGEALWAALVLGAGYSIGSYAENFAAYFQAVERMHVWTAANAAYGIVAGLAGAVLIWSTHSLPWFCAAMVLGHLAAVFWLLRTYRRDHPARTRVAASGNQSVRALLRAAVPFAAAFLALTLFYKADVLILSGVRPDADVGMYTAAYKLVDIAQALMLAAIIATYPRLARATAARAGAGPWAGSRLAELALLIMAPVAALGFLLRERILAGLYGSAYQDAAAPAGFLVLALLPLALNLLGGYILAATDRMKVMVALYGGAALVKLTAVAIVAPRWGGAGVAAAMLGSELLLGASFLIALRHTAHAAPGWRALAGVLATAAGCAFAALVPGDSAVVRVLVLLALVVPAYVWLDVVPAEERAVLRAALRPGSGRARVGQL